MSTKQDGPFRFWFERRPPERYAELLEGSAVIVGYNTGNGADPATISEAEAVVASARVRYDAELMDRVPGLRDHGHTPADLAETDQAEDETVELDSLVVVEHVALSDAERLGGHGDLLGGGEQEGHGVLGGGDGRPVGHVADCDPA